MHALSSGMRRVTKFNVIEVIEVNGGGGGEEGFHASLVMQTFVPPRALLNIMAV